jgi:hypothetical protein
VDGQFANHAVSFSTLYQYWTFKKKKFQKWRIKENNDDLKWKQQLALEKNKSVAPNQQLAFGFHFFA